MAKRKDISSDKTDTSSGTSPRTVSDTAGKISAIETKATAAETGETSEIAPPAGPTEPISAEAAKPAQSDRLAVADNSAPPAAASAPARRFLHLAAAVALAAALGAVLGSMGSAGVARLLPQFSANAVASNNGFAEESRALRQLTAKFAADVQALKQSIETASRSTNSQFAKLAERLERARTEPAAKLARISEALDRLERRVAIETTGSVAARQDTSKHPKQQDKPPVVTGWVLRDIVDGHALVEGRDGLYEVGPGGNLPGVGRVETIQRQNGRWVVVTAKGLIVSAR